MCGIFGFHGDSPDLGIVSLMATEAGRRGPHSYGACWLSNGSLLEVKGDGSFSDNAKGFLHNLEKSPNIRWIVGHSRMSTVGAVHDEGNIQPLISDGHVLSHNGNVYNYNQLLASGWYRPTTTNDSEAIFAIRGELGCKDWLRLALDRVDKSSPLALILASTNGDFSAGRRNHPLYQLRTEGGIYYCSRPANKHFRMISNDEAY